MEMQKKIVGVAWELESCDHMVIEKSKITIQNISYIFVEPGSVCSSTCPENMLYLIMSKIKSLHFYSVV